MHYSFGMNPSANQVSNKLLSHVQQSGKAEILIANHVIMLLFVLPEDLVSVWIQFDSKAASAACLLWWDCPFPFGGPVVIMVLPACVFPGAPVHALLPQIRESDCSTWLTISSIAFSNSSAVSQVRNASASAHSHVMPPFSWLYVKLPHLGALAQGAFHLWIRYVSLFLEIEDPVGISKVGMWGGLGGMKGLFVHSSLSFRSTKCVIYVLFMCCLFII